ncbi:MAG: acyl--CoA ligase, partial [Cloacibacillus porcorum]|nr:acyl--CoA ligase [Cloacibacillus porcorum]
MPITDLLERNAKEFCHETALVEINPEVKELRRVTWKEYELIESSPTESYRREITWSVFDEKANRCANLLLSRGIKKGDKVAILMMNSLEWLPLYFGILKTGALAVPLNFRYTAEEIKYCLELADVDALFFGPEFIGRVEDICEQIPRVKLIFYIGDSCPRFAENYLHLTANLSSYAPRILLSDEDDAAIYFSSGTTGFPKAILHNHESLMHAAKVEQSHHGQRHDDVFLCIPPLYHTGAKMHWFGSLISGSKGILLKGTDPISIIKTVSDEKCTIVWLLVPWVQDILDAIDAGKVRLEDYELSQWRLMHIGAQPVPPSLINRWRRVFPKHRYDTNYGLSESIGPGCVHLGVGNIDKVGAIGVPGYGWKVKIVDDEGRPVTNGGVGELAVKGPGVMTCYYNDPKATAEVLHDGWLATGDMARQDEQGFIYLVDRKKDVIISGGENIYPVQVEDFLRAHPSIKDAAVIGLPDQRLGEIAAAIIELKEGFTCTEEEIEKFCLDLPRYKRPRRIIFAEIPRNPTGKIEK